MHTVLHRKIFYGILLAGVLGVLFSNSASAEEIDDQAADQKNFRDIAPENLEKIEKLHAEAEGLIVQNNFRSAIQKYMEILLIEPDDETAYANMGHCYLILGDTGRAKDAFQNALDIDPENELALEGLQKIKNPDKPKAAYSNGE